MKQVLEFFPLIVFFALFKLYDMHTAVYGIVIATIITISLHLLLYKTISKMTLFSAGLVVFFGASSVIFDSPEIFKMKPTIANLVFAAIALYDVMNNAKWLKKNLGKKFRVDTATYKNLELLWVASFILFAISNEIVWRNFNDVVWINFKIFGLTVANFILIFASMYYIMSKHNKNCSNDTYSKK